MLYPSGYSVAFQILVSKKLWSKESCNGRAFMWLLEVKLSYVKLSISQCTLLQYWKMIAKLEKKESFKIANE